MLLSVRTVEHLTGYRLRLTFNDGLTKDVDFSRHWDALFGPVFQPLRNPNFFAQVFLPPDSETIEWPNGADLDAEYLYEIGTPVPSIEQAVALR